MSVRKGIILDPVTSQPIRLYQGGSLKSDSLSLSELFNPDFSLQILNEFLWDYYQLSSENYTYIQQEVYEATEYWVKQDDQWVIPRFYSLAYLKTSRLGLSSANKKVYPAERTAYIQTNWSKVAEILSSNKDLVSSTYLTARLMCKQSRSKISCKESFKRFLFRKYSGLIPEGYTVSEILTILNHVTN